MQEGDSVAVFRREDVPFVVSRAAGNDAWRLVGDAYAHGIMYGGAEDELGSGMDDIALV